jgi:hypothetical protein
MSAWQWSDRQLRVGNRQRRIKKQETHKMRQSTIRRRITNRCWFSFLLGLLLLVRASTGYLPMMHVGAYAYTRVVMYMWAYAPKCNFFCVQETQWAFVPSRSTVSIERLSSSTSTLSRSSEERAPQHVAHGIRHNLYSSYVRPGVGTRWLERPPLRLWQVC